MTATPIPRTLYLSLSGIRDISVIETPPLNRLPIRTFVMEYSDEVVREAIVRECEHLLTDTEAYQAMSRAHNPYGDGQAVGRIVNTLQSMQGRF